jgi:hypothetical protein
LIQTADQATPEQLAALDRDAAIFAAAQVASAKIHPPHPSDIEHNYKRWLTSLLGQHFRGIDQFGEHHERFWEWGWPLELGVRPAMPACLAIWPRGGNKSTSAEGFAVACGARGRRKFGLYVCRTQPQADSHIASISSMLLRSKVSGTYPQMGDPKVHEVGGRTKQAAWNRSVLTTSSGFTMQGFGLTSSFRGVRVEEYRPDLIIISDVDDIGDSPAYVQSLLGSLAGSVFGTASNDCVVLFEQNLIHHNSMMNQILTRATDVLSERLEIGPIPAVRDIKYERRSEKWFIIGGTPSWVGQDIAACQHKLNTEGKDYFDRECQHDVDRVLGRPRFLHEAIALFKVYQPTMGELRNRRNEFGDERQEFYPTEKGVLAVWRAPQQGHIYACGADTSEGIDVAAGVASNTDPDYAVAQVRDAQSGEQVARLRGRITEGVFGEMLYALLRWYNNAYLVPEVKGGYGRATLNKLLELGYPQALIFNRHLFDEFQGLPPYRGQISYHDLGFDTSLKTRPVAIQKLDDAILKHTIETYDAVTIEEYRHFCYNPDGKPEAEPGYHDDCVMSDALCVIGMTFAKKFEQVKAHKAVGQAIRTKYNQPKPRIDLEEEAFWRQNQRPGASLR